MNGYRGTNRSLLGGGLGKAVVFLMIDDCSSFFYPFAFFYFCLEYKPSRGKVAIL